MKLPGFLSLLLLAVCLTGCDSPERTAATAAKQIEAYKAAPDEAKQAEVEKTLAKLDAEIVKLQDSGKTVEAASLQRQAANLHADFQAARMARALLDARNAIQGFGEAIKQAGQSFTETLKSGGTNATGQ